MELQINPCWQREMRGGDGAGSDGGSSPPPNKAEGGETERDAKSQSAPPSRRRHRASDVPNVKVERRCHGDKAYS